MQGFHPLTPLCRPKRKLMQKTSINIQPVKPGCEAHNFREKKLDYVREDLSHLNEHRAVESISARLDTIKENYRNTTGQAMQKKATPIREGVIVIERGTSMQQLRNFADKCEERFGIKAFQIHIHRDEGYKNGEEWKPNLHAHIVFDWTQENGKSCKLSRLDMVEMQTLLAKELEMSRGVSSDREHLSAIQFKNEQEKSRSEALKKEIAVLQPKKKAQEAISKASERFKDLLGVSTNDKEKESIKNALNGFKLENTKLLDANSKLTGKNRSLSEELTRERKNSENYRAALQRERQGKEVLQEKISGLNRELAEFSKSINEEAKAFIRERFQKVHEAIQSGLESIRNLTQSRGRGMGM